MLTLRVQATPLLAAAIATATAAAAIAALWHHLPVPPKQLRDRLSGPKADEAKAQMDQQMYENTAKDGFWNDADDMPLRLVNAARIPYFASKWSQEIHTPPGLSRFLDVGCGGGVATEELAKLGFPIIGLDPASGAIACARQRAQHLNIEGLEYTQGSAFELPWPSDSFNGVVSSDVLEHLDDVQLALNEIFRVLKPGGVFVFDTINRTLYSWLTTILIAQRWLQYVPRDAHDWRLYITPAELRRGLSKAGFEVAPSSDWVGMGPKLYLPHQVLYRGLYLGKGAGSFFGPWRQSRYNTAVSYLGWARKPAN